MVILSWNIRGVGHRGFKTQLIGLLEAQTPDVIILVETKVNPHMTQQIIQSLNISDNIEILPKGFLGAVGFYGSAKPLFSYTSYILIVGLFTVEYSTNLKKFPGMHLYLRYPRQSLRKSLETNIPFT